MIREGERDRRFARRVEESSRRVLAFKKKWKPGRVPVPAVATTEKLSRQLWEFGEEIRLAALDLETIGRQERSL
jgi:hypothetical protein